MQNRNFTTKKNNYAKQFSCLAILFLLSVLYVNTASAQCADDQTEITISMGSELFSGDNGWVLWDATANSEILCVDAWVNNTDVTTCISNGNNIQLYAYESWGDGWEAVLTVTTSEDATNYTNGCAPNLGSVLFTGGYPDDGTFNTINCGTSPVGTGLLLGSFSTTCILCAITCPSDITVNADPALCGANVTLPLPITSGICTPGAVDMSGFFPVGTTEVTFDADGSGASGGVSCSMFVTVQDMTTPTINAPSNVTFSLAGGECGSIYNYQVSADDACGDQAVSITQSTDPLSVNNSFACPGGPNNYYRVFNLNDEGITTDVNITAVNIGVFQAFNLPAVTVRIHELTGGLNVANFELVSENTMNINNTLFDIVTFPIVATLEPGIDYVIEIVTPGTIFNGFVMGTNDAGQSAPSYISSTFCNLPDITNLATFDPSLHLVISLDGIQQAISIEQTAGLEPGSEFPIGVTTNTFLVTDASGNTSTRSFNVTVNEFANPVNTLACNDQVNVSLDGNCEGLITPDMVLQGNQYGCFDNYTVIIKDKAGNVFGNIVTGDMVGLDLIAEVYDPSGNFCWGEILIEDKLPPQLECTTRTTQCTQETTPGASLANEMRFTIEPNIIIPINTASTIDIPFEINGLDGATITDVNLEIMIDHTWISDLGVVLISPEGTELTAFLAPGTNCGENNVNLTIDDEAALTSVDLQNACTTNNPSVEGDFQPIDLFSAFDGEDPNGTWIIRVLDFAAFDGGTVRKITLEVSQSGGRIGLPIPDGATYSSAGAQKYFVFGLDPCGPAILTYEDVVDKMDCSSPYTEVIYRTYTATDESGNNAVSCTDTINVLRTDLGSLELPRNYNDLDLPSLNCSAGYPTPAVTGSPTGSFCDNVEIEYQDIVIDICEGSYKILRYWQIFEWCNSEIVEYTQIIKVADKLGPNIQCPTILPVSTSPSDCTGSILLPKPVITDNCTEIPTYTVSNTSGTLVQQGQNYSLIDLAPGSHTVTYIASDNCGNTSSCSFTFVVVDNISPVAVCDKHTTVAISFDNLVTVDALTFDDGSYDECSDVTMTARRMTDACGIAGNTTFGPSVKFCCEDVGKTIMVAFRVEDASGNFNTCMVEVTVQDKIAPAIQVPPNVTLSCQDDYKDLNLTGGMALGFDNCLLDTIFFQDLPSIGSCGSGQVSRLFTVRDRSGLIVTGTQTIFLIDNDPFDANDIFFPPNVLLTSCNQSTDPSATGIPILYDDICSQVSYTYWDEKFTIVEDACEVIYRKWTVIDQCQYNSNFPNIGIWEDIQEIEITNTTKPIITTPCNNVTIDAIGNCEGPVSLSFDATDDCTPAEKLVFTWKVDLFDTNDGIFEFQNTGKTMSGVYPFGTHRIFWTVADRCGNSASCSYLFTVRDVKAPTPYCISTLSTAVMNTNGKVVIWASDFALDATDNCTNPEDIIVSFTQNGITSTREFSCDDITNGIAQLIDDIQVWFTDAAGNKDFCTVSLVLEDNQANFCDDLGTITVSGEIKNDKNVRIEKVDVIAMNTLSNDPINTFADEGTYSFDLIPNFNYEISADKNSDFLNGVTTLDIVLIQKHILAIQEFTSPHTTIAADVNNDSKVSGSDIISIRKAILGKITEFPNGQRSWRFVDKKATFTDVYNVFPFNESINLAFTSGNTLQNDFIGIKIADINGSASVNKAASDVSTRSTEALEFIMDNQMFKTGDVFEIPVFANNFESMIGYQMTIDFDPTKLNILDVKEGDLMVFESDFNMDFANKGMISTVWSSTEAVSSDKVLFYFVVEALQNGDLTNVLKTSDRLTKSLAYNDNYDESEIKISVRVNDQIISPKESLVLYQNAPNPFSGETMIAFDLPVNDFVYINVYGVNGETVHTISRDFKAGYNTITINSNDLLASGVYYYTVTTSDESASSKMILID